MQQTKGLGWLATILAILVMLPAAYAATTGNLGATLTIGNAAPAITDISCTSSVTLSAGTSVNSACYFNVSDNNGVGDLVLDAINMSATNGTASVLNSTTCKNFANYTTTIAGFNCTFSWVYYTSPLHVWNVSISAYDGTAMSTNNTRNILGNNISINSLTALAIVTPLTNITFGASIAAGSNNNAADNDPVILNNTGNVLVTQINISANNLTGVTTDTEHIWAANFTANDADAAGGEALDEETSVTVVDTTLPFGAPATAQDSVYVYVSVAAGLSTQEFSATKTGRAWVWGIV